MAFFRPNVPPRILLPICFPLILGACSTITALTLPEHRGTPSKDVRLSFGQCTSASEFSSLIDAPTIISTAINQVQSAFKSTIEKKKNRFTATYTARATLDSFRAGQCLRVLRYASQDKEPLLDLEIELRPRGSSSVEFAPKKLLITDFATSTSPKNGNLSAVVSVSAAISFVNRNQVNGPDPITELELPIAFGNYTINKSPPEVFNSQSSKLFPRIDGRAVNVAISITEKGNGSKELQSGLDGFDANAAALRSILGIGE